MHAVRRLVETFAGFVDVFWLAFHFRAEGAFEDVTYNRTGVTVRWRGLARSVSNLDERYFEIFPSRLRKRMREYDSIARVF